MLRSFSVTRSRDTQIRFNPASARASTTPLGGVDVYTGRLRARSNGESPGTAGPSAAGTATVTQADGRCRCTIWVRDIAGVTSVELRVGTPGPDGVIVVPLFSDDAGTDLDHGVLVSASIPDAGAGGVTLASIMAMMARGGGYVVVRTFAHPEGEIGGPITLR